MTKLARNLASVVFTASVCFALSSQAATVYTYDIGTNVGTGGTLLSTDGWTGDDLPNWVTNSFSGALYARNNNGGDNTINRSNDGSFSYSIPANTTQLNLTIAGRSGGISPSGIFWQVGLAQGTTQRLGIGVDFGDDDSAFILDNGTRRRGTLGTVSGDANRTFEVRFDLVNGTADLLQDGTLLLDDQAMSLPFATLQATDGLFIRTNSQFGGPSSITIEAIPEPGSGVLISLVGVLGLIRRRK